MCLSTCMDVAQIVCAWICYSDVRVCLRKWLDRVESNMMFARKGVFVRCCRAFCRRWASVDWGSVWCKTSGWWLAWLWIVCVSVAFAAALWFRMCRVIWEKMVACICCKCVEMDDRFCVEAWRHMWDDVVLAQKVAKQDGMRIGCWADCSFNNHCLRVL